MSIKSHRHLVAEREAIGLRLQFARLAARLSLADLAAQTKVSSRFLDAIEQGDFAALPSRVHCLGFVRAFARAVGLDETEVLSALRVELAATGQTETVRPAPAHRGLRNLSLRVRSLIGTA